MMWIDYSENKTFTLSYYAAATLLDNIQDKECDVCKKERAEKKLVLTDPNDPRVRLERFMSAPAIFPNNDIKFEVTKARARIFATEKGQSVTWSQAKDHPNSVVLSEKPYNRREITVAKTT